jgi:hypothetical protein
VTRGANTNSLSTGEFTKKKTKAAISHARRFGAEPVRRFSKDSKNIPPPPVGISVDGGAGSSARIIGFR